MGITKVRCAAALILGHGDCRPPASCLRWFAPMSHEDAVFEVGDVVSLKSGGHLMTVASINEGSVTCDWSVSGDVKSKSFPAAELKHANELKLRGKEGGAISSVVSRCRR